MGWRLILVGAALLVFAGTARGANPKVTLKMEKATPAEVIAALSQASGVPLAPTYEVMQAPEQRASFEWADVTLARALRDVCGKFLLQPRRMTDGSYSLYPTPGPAAPPGAKQVGLFERNGIRLYATGTTIEERRSRQFAGMVAAADDSRVQVRLQCELGEGDADGVLGIENAVARDDTGSLLTPGSAQPYYGGYMDPSFPDEWRTTLSFPSPHPKARKLATVEGDLVAYRTVRPLKVEIPLPPQEKSIRREVGDWLIVVSQYEPTPKEPEDDDRGLPDLVARQAIAGPRLRLRVYYPVRSRIGMRTGWGIFPTMVGQSGRTYACMSMGGAGAGNGTLTLTDSRISFASGGDPPVKLVWDLIEKSDPVKLVSFRMEDIPLPGPSSFVPRTGEPARTPGGNRLDPDHPFALRGGGSIGTRVEIAGSTRADGTLQIGLAAKNGAGWGPVRWTEVDVGLDGLVRLDDVKPGSYLLRRVFRPFVTLPASGKWLSADTPVVVVAGKETAAPPLRWQKDK